MFSGEGGLLYLDLEDVLVLYASIFECSEQEAADQLRYANGLEIALTRPANYADYARADVALQAAVLAHGIAELQPFIEGNKRTAELAFVAFLEENGYRLTASQSERADWIKELSEGIPPETLAEHIRVALAPAHRE